MRIKVGFIAEEDIHAQWSNVRIIDSKALSCKIKREPHRAGKPKKHHKLPARGLT